MTDTNSAKVTSKLNDQAMLDLLAALEKDASVTQRGLAHHVGVALGLVNSLLKRAARKGLVKVSEAPAKRYAYYLTPKGFAEKSRLVAEYLSSSLDFFRQAREEYNGVYEEALARGHNRLAIYGTGELAEIAMLSAQDLPVEVLGVIHPGSNKEQFLGVPVYSAIETGRDCGIDAVVLTCSDAPQEAYQALRSHFTDEQIYIAPLLHVTRPKDSGGE